MIDKKIKAAEAANKIIKERAEQEKKDAVANAAAAKQQAQIAAAAKTAELMEEKSEGTPRQPETTDDYSNHSSPKQNTAQATAKQQETLLNRLDMYTSFVWDKYDVDKDGSLDATEFETFLRGKETNCSIQFPCLFFLSWLDHDLIQITKILVNLSNLKCFRG